VGFIAKDDPKLIRARVAKRKQILTDDRVTINIDTFHDHTHAYWFDVNPYAIQLDGITTDAYGDDFSWEGLWYSEAKITPDGYVVLITVPFKTIRFPDAAEQHWGVMLGRFIGRNNEFSMWPYITRRKLPQFVAQFGHVEGLQGISPGRNVQFIPYGLVSGQKYLDRTPGAVPGIVTEPAGRGGVDAKVVIKDALTLDMTFNPDFSQIESDEPQVTVNQRYEVFFPEKRPFFLENNSYFTTPQNLFFTRRVIDPEYGLRLTGKLGRWGIGVLAADDRAPGKQVAADDPLRGKRAVNGVLSLQRDFFKDSHLRLFVTDREFASEYNRVGSLDTRLHLKRDFFLVGQAATSATRGQTDGAYTGNDYFVRLSRTDRKTQYYSTYTDRSPGFRAELGYIPRVDIREFKNRFGVKKWFEKRTVMNVGAAVVALGNWNRQGDTQDWMVAPEVSLEMLRLTQFVYSYSEIFELYRGQGFRYHANNFVAKTEWYKWLAAQATYMYGTGVNYYPAFGLQPFLANSSQLNAGVTVRPTSRLRVDETYLQSRLTTRPGSPLAPASTTVFTNNILRTKANYQFTRALSFRAIVDYNAVEPNRALIDVQRTRKVGYDLLLTYLLHPGTALYVGYTDIYQNLRLDPSRPPYLQYGPYPYLNTGRQLFAKLSYLFRF
jgi:hypothetical protein